jgi:hypothetical protein
LIKEISHVQFRDHVELQQATKWLHENGEKFRRRLNRFLKEIYLGIIVHFEDTLLSNYYFLDPQYLAELLAQLIASEQTNGLARHGEFHVYLILAFKIISLGLMKINELSVTFQDTNVSMLDNISILLRLSQKFDLAITWDNQHLIFPSLLPTQLSLNTIVSVTILHNYSEYFFHSSPVIVVHRLYHHRVLLNLKKPPIHQKIDRYQVLYI